MAKNGRDNPKNVKDIQRATQTGSTDSSQQGAKCRGTVSRKKITVALLDGTTDVTDSDAGIQ